MVTLDDIREHVRRNRWGMLTDLAFAVVWVTIVEVLFSVVDGPQFAYYLFMFAGILVYYLLFTMPLQTDEE